MTKCCSPLTQGGTCRREAGFVLGSRPYCRRHAAENIFLAVLATPHLQSELNFTKVSDDELTTAE